MKGIGYGMIVVSGYICVYFAVLIAYVLFYLIFSFTSRLPFSHCDNAWNTPNCTIRDGTRNLTNGSTTTTTTTRTPSEEFFYRNVLGLSDGIEDLGLPEWRLTLLLLACWAITLVGLIKGSVYRFSLVKPFNRGVVLPRLEK